jgi:hypothetical protein
MPVLAFRVKREKRKGMEYGDSFSLENPKNASTTPISNLVISNEGLGASKWPGKIESPKPGAPHQHVDGP